MIPRAALERWRQVRAPWPDLAVVERDLVLTRALVALFTDPLLADRHRLRGGAALQRLYLDPPARPFADLDLMQVRPQPAGPSLDAIRDALAWLGEMTHRVTDLTLKVRVRFPSRVSPGGTQRLDLEVNTRDQFAVFPPCRRELTLENPWFTGGASVPTSSLEELLGTKLRALYQRTKGRDLFDLVVATRRLRPDTEQVTQAFRAYLDRHGLAVTRAEFRENLRAKLRDERFREDALALPSPQDLDLEEAAELVDASYLRRL